MAEVSARPRLDTKAVSRLVDHVEEGMAVLGLQSHDEHTLPAAMFEHTQLMIRLFETLE